MNIMLFHSTDDYALPCNKLPYTGLRVDVYAG